MQLSEKITAAADATIFPFRKHVIDTNGRRKWTHGVETNETIHKRFLDQHRYLHSVVDYAHRRDTVNSSDPKLLDGPWMFGGLLYPHFGHFLSESIHRLWAWPLVSSSVDGVVFISVGQSKAITNFPDYVLQYFNSIGLSVDKVRLISNTTKVKKLVLPECGSAIGEPQSNWYIDILKNSSHATRSLNTPKNIFFSRAAYLNSGKIIGLSALEKELEKQGFLVVQPEKLSLQEQLSLIVNAENIIWEESSNIHLLDLLPNIQANVCLIKRRRNLQTFDFILNQKTKHYTHCEDAQPLVKSKLPIPFRRIPSVIPDYKNLFSILETVSVNPPSNYQNFERSLANQERNDILRYCELNEFSIRSAERIELLQNYASMTASRNRERDTHFTS